MVKFKLCFLLNIGDLLDFLDFQASHLLPQTKNTQAHE